MDLACPEDLLGGRPLPPHMGWWETRNEGVPVPGAGFPFRR